jgi:hypothetical protein
LKLEGAVAASVFPGIGVLSCLLLVDSEILMFRDISVLHCVRDMFKLWLDYIVGAEWFSLFQGSSRRLYSPFTGRLSRCYP